MRIFAVGTKIFGGPGQHLGGLVPPPAQRRTAAAYHKLKKKPSTIAQLQTTLQKIWNELPQKPVAKAVQAHCLITHLDYTLWGKKCTLLFFCNRPNFVQLHCILIIFGGYASCASHCRFSVIFHLNGYLVTVWLSLGYDQSPADSAGGNICHIWCAQNSTLCQNSDEKGQKLKVTRTEVRLWCLAEISLPTSFGRVAILVTTIRYDTIR